MPDLDVVILTDHRYERPADPDWYARQVLLEDGLVERALQARGLRTDRVDWARPASDFGSARAALFRTTWDYFHRAAEFACWLDDVSTRTRLLNPAELVRWNMDKHYLADLATRGVRVVPTSFVERGGPVRVETLLDGRDRVVIKPAIGGAARETYLFGRAESAALETRLVELAAREAMLVQPFQEAILDDGERSLVVIGDAVTHAVVKRARPGDFRVQDDHGGSVTPYTPESSEIDFALAAVATCVPRPLYARVDFVVDGGGPLLMELELVEPELFFRLNPPAAEALADEVVRALSGSPTPSGAPRASDAG